MLAIAKSLKELMKPLMAFPTKEVDLTAAIYDVINARPPSKRSTYFRMGEINNRYACDRRILFVGMEKIYTDRIQRDPKGVLLMDLGSALHEVIQEELLGPSGNLLGHWRCPTCHGRRSKRYDVYPKEFCTNKVMVTPDGGEPWEVSCAEKQAYLKSRGNAYWKYEEIALKDEARNLSGRVDGVWLEIGGGWYVLEIKSIDTKVFNDLRAVPIKPDQAKAIKNLTAKTLLVEATADLPKDYHLSQAAVYSGLLQEKCLFDEDFPLDMSDFRGALITYVDRNTMELKTYLREDIESEFQHADEVVTSRLDALAAADMEVRDDEEEDAARIEANRKIAFRFSATCTNRNHFKAKECPWRTVCFPYKKAEKNGVEFLAPAEKIVPDA